jgi:hypothetical protein
MNDKTVKTKKEPKKNTKIVEAGELKSKEDLKGFLLTIRDRMQDDGLAAIHALSALNFVLNGPDVYRLMDNEGKEIARDIFLRIKQAGLQLRNPSLLFQE